MSGDHGTSVSVPAALAAAREFSDVRFTLIGRQPDLERELGTASPSNVSCLFASDVVEMTDHPREALRRKKDSSMRRAIDLVKAHDAHACVSAGNTGALMATAHFVLKMLPGVERPAIVSLIPSRGGHTYMLDLGANASCTPLHLSQFAVMGSVLAADLEGAHDNPRVGLLNIGEEEIKGNDIVQAAHNLLTDSDLEFTRTSLRKLGALAVKPVLNALRTRLDPRRYNGASMVGLNGIVIKSHGDTDLYGFQRAIEVAVLEARNGVPAQIAQRLAASRET